MLRQAGANAVYFVSISPEIRYRNIYGIDIPKTTELVANFVKHKNQTIAEYIGADEVFFTDLPDILDTMKGLNKHIEYEHSMFNNIHPDFKALEQPGIMSLLSIPTMTFKMNKKYSRQAISNEILSKQNTQVQTACFPTTHLKY